MLVTERKASILDQLKRVEDEQILKVIEAVLKVHLEPVVETEVEEELTDKISISEEDGLLGYRSDGTPVYAKEASIVYEQRLKEMKAGKFYTVSEARELRKTW